MQKISILICTYNRDYILRDCLDSLVNQTADKSLYEVIVINNNSTDDTQKIAEEYVVAQPNFRVVIETNQGLSHARNRGYKEAKYDWASYVDDDAKVYPNYVERALFTIENYDFDFFGGMFYPWYRNTIRPKWLSENFGKSEKHKNTIDYLDNGSITGCVCVFNKKSLEDIDGFPLDLGMIGTTIAYGEETYVQQQLVEKGYKVGFDPELCIDHLVPEYKQTLKWQIQSAYAYGRDSVKLFNDGKLKESYLKYLRVIIKGFLKSFFISMRLLITRKNYYWQNMVLDIFSPIARYRGYYKAK